MRSSPPDPRIQPLGELAGDSTWASPPGGMNPQAEAEWIEVVRKCAQEHLGQLAILADHSWAYGESHIVEAEAASVGRVFLKSHRKSANYSAELAAYQMVVPHLRGRAPSLVAFDDEHQLLVLTAVRGTRVDILDDERDYLAAHGLAGEVLSWFHAAAPIESIEDWADRQQHRLDEWLARDTLRVVRRDERAFVSSMVRAISHSENVDLVWAHRDWRPRNWIYDGIVVYAIDFEHSRQDHWTADVSQLYFSEWTGRRDLAEAFFAGYGRSLSPSDWEKLTALAAISCLVTIIWSLHDGAEDIAANARQSLANLRRIVA